MKLSALLIDDENPAVETLELMLNNYCPNVEVIAKANSVDDAASLLKSTNPNLIFLDIRMPGKDGFKLFDEADLSKSHVIFTTAYDQYALKAFTVSASHYLLKPISPNELIAAVNRAKESSQRFEHAEERLDFLKNVLKDRTVSFPDKILVPIKKGYEIVKVENIRRVEGDRNYAKVILKSDIHYVVAKTLREIEETLNPKKFCRVHQSHIVNIEEIAGIGSGSNAEISLRSGEVLPVSRSRKKELMDLLKTRW